MSETLPVIDLSPFATDEPTAEAAAVAADLDRALRETGFVLIEGHGISREAAAEMFAEFRRFFALPTAEKQAIAIQHSPHFRGYSGVGAEVVDEAYAQAGDLKETYDSGVELGPDHPLVRAGTPLHGGNQWPAAPEFRAAHTRYMGESIAAAERMQRALAVALGLAPRFFLGQGDTMYHLRANYYPVQAERAPGRWGCGAHSDYGLGTLLIDDGAPGLQVMYRDGSWRDITVPEGLVLFNLGDLGAIWTNDRWVSNPHRVVPVTERERMSIPLFIVPPFFTSVECLPGCLAEGEAPRYEPRLAGPYLLGRFDVNYNYRNALLEQHLRAESAAAV